MSASKQVTPRVKPVVRYSTTLAIEVGLPAVVIAFDHPSHLILPGEVVRTSTVQSYDEATGIFETRNSIYKPLED